MHMGPQLMGLMQRKLAISVSTGVVLGAIALLTYAAAAVQNGPTWEVPAQAATIFFFALVIAPILNFVGVATYFRKPSFRAWPVVARWGFWAFLVAGISCWIVLLTSNPGQWPLKSPKLSAGVRAVCWPVLSACGFLWILSVAFSKSATK